MKVGLISFHTFVQPGGVKRHIFGLAKEFKKRGVEYKIIAPRRKRKEYYDKDVILLGTSFPIDFSGSKADFCINFNPLAIEKVLKKEKFDVLHFHNFGLPSTLEILTSPATSNTLNILTFHANLDGSKSLKKFPGILSLINKVCERKIDGIIGVAPFILKYFKKYSGPKTVIPNGIDLEIFNPNVPALEKYSDGKINILFLGRIEERKGLIYLLRAYKILTKKFSNLRLIIVGDGPLKKDLETQVKKDKLQNVIFEGAIPEDQVVRYYRTCDIYCSPAIFGESFGMVLIEAMACGKPVVAFANEGYKIVLSGKGEKFLVKPKDYKTLAEKLEILIRDKKLRKIMGEWGIQESQKYSWQKITDQVLNFYEYCSKNRPKKKKSNNFTLLKKAVKKLFG